MIIKMMGAAIVILASSLLGIYFSRLDHYRIEDLRTLKKGMTMLESEIHYAISPLPAAMKQIGFRIEGKVSHFFLDTSKELERRTGKNITTIWTEVVEKNIQSTYFSKEDKQFLLSFGKTLGYLDREMQKKNIQLLIGYIDEQIEKLSDHKQKNGKLYRSLGILGGLLISIVLL